MAISWHVPEIIPRGVPNLITGNSGSGKTRFIAPLLDALIDGREVMGRPTNATKVFYVACDRPLEYARATWEDLKLDPGKLAMFSFMDQEIPWNFEELIKRIPEGTELVFIEAFAMLLPDPVGKQPLYKAAMTFMRKLNLFSKQRKIDFFCSSHPPKMKAGESFTSGRNSSIGSVGIPASAGTVIEIIETGMGLRKIIFNVHMGACFEIDYCFDGRGQLVEMEQETAEVIFNCWLGQQSYDPIPFAKISDYIVAKGFNERTARRCVNAAIQASTLEKADYGFFRRRKVS